MCRGDCNGTCDSFADHIEKLENLLRRCLEIDDDAMLELDNDKHPPSSLRVEIEEILNSPLECEEE